MKLDSISSAYHKTSDYFKSRDKHENKIKSLPCTEESEKIGVNHSHRHM